MREMKLFRPLGYICLIFSFFACKGKPPSVSIYKTPKGNTELQAAKFERMAAMLKEKRLHGQN